MSGTVYHDQKVSGPGAPVLLTSGLGTSVFGIGQGPGGDLFVPHAETGQIYRIDVKTGERTTFASGLPQLISAIGIGGITDVTFIGAQPTRWCQWSAILCSFLQTS